MSTPTIPPFHVPAPMPNVQPLLLPDPNAAHVAGSDTGLNSKQLQDLDMRKLYGPLWREARELSRRSKAESREQTSSPDVMPRMEQQTRAPADKMDWLDYSLPVAKRAGAQQVSPCWQSHSISWLQVTADSYQLKAQLVGDIDPHRTCIGDVPVFVDGNPWQANALLPDYSVRGEQRVVLDFTGTPAIAEKCNVTAAFDCVVPDASRSVNDQIDDVLESTSDAYVYLSPQQLDDWAASKADSVKGGSLRYIRLSASPVDRNTRTTLGGIITGALAGAALLAAGAVRLVRRCTGSREDASNDTAVNMQAVNREPSAGHHSQSAPSSSEEV